MSTSNNRLRHPIVCHRRSKAVLLITGRARYCVERPGNRCQLMKVGKPRVSRTHKPDRFAAATARSRAA